jgi:glycosyltransferase involved in cell wall biosynthesis
MTRRNAFPATPHGSAVLPVNQFSIIVTCKGRLAHLKHTLPRFMRQPNTQVIVVDYSCPQNTGDFVETHFPRAQVLRVENRELFNVSLARNAGAAVARTPYLIFVDADTIISANFTTLLPQHLTGSNFLRFYLPNANSLGGTCVVMARDFQKIEGYDEVFSGYGGEDLDFYWRLRRMGVTLQVLQPANAVRWIQHDHALRTAYYETKDVKQSFLQARAYRLVKEVLLGLSLEGELPLAERRKLWADIAAAIAADRFEIKVRLPGNSTSGFLKEWNWQRELLVSFAKVAS